jgi:hypothetical protein
MFGITVRLRGDPMLSTKVPLEFETERVAPRHGFEPDLDRILKSRNLLILKSRQSRQKPQKQGLGTKSVQKSFDQSYGDHGAF